jgi:urease accessory protein
MTSIAVTKVVKPIVMTTTTRTAFITTILEPAPTPALLRLLQLCSPALPIGAFAYSQALEPAVTAGWVRDEADACAWITGQLGAQLATLDLPLLARFYDAWGDDDRTADTSALDTWSAFLVAARPSAELQVEDRLLGAALARVLDGLGVTTSRGWQGRTDVTHAAMFALAARRWSVPLPAAAQGFAFAWAEAQTSAAVRLVPLGQSAGQRILSSAIAVIPETVVRALALDDADVGATAPRLAIASAWHETQYSRLFRS